MHLFNIDLITQIRPTGQNAAAATESRSRLYYIHTFITQHYPRSRAKNPNRHKLCGSGERRSMKVNTSPVRIALRRHPSVLHAAAVGDFSFRRGRARALNERPRRITLLSRGCMCFCRCCLFLSFSLSVVLYWLYSGRFLLSRSAIAP